MSSMRKAGKSGKSGGNGLLLLLAIIVLFAASIAAFTVITKDPRANVETLGQASQVIENVGFEAHYIDVGQGDCELIICGGEAMLIDAGEADKASGVIEYIKKLGITELKYVVATHPHSDHIGGIPAVLDAFEVKDFIAPDAPHTTKTFERMLDAVERNGLEITIAEPMDEYAVGDAKLTVLSPKGDSYESLNNFSVVLRAVFGETAFLFTGDAETEAETEMLNANMDLKSDVLKVGHHGSSTSTSKRFLNAVFPEYAVISCGLDNSYNHPHKETMEKLRDIKVYQTKDNGTVIAKTDGKIISFETTR